MNPLRFVLRSFFFNYRLFCWGGSSRVRRWWEGGVGGGEWAGLLFLLLLMVVVVVVVVGVVDVVVRVLLSFGRSLTVSAVALVAVGGGAALRLAGAGLAAVVAGGGGAAARAGARIAAVLGRRRGRLAGALAALSTLHPQTDRQKNHVQSLRRQAPRRATGTVTQLGVAATFLDNSSRNRRYYTHLTLK